MHDHDRGLTEDLRTLARLDRRQALRWLAGAAAIPFAAKLLGCDDDGARVVDATNDGNDAASDTSVPDECPAAIPEETGGPYPGDGTNGPNALTLDDIVRRDIRSSIGTLSGTAAGVPLLIRLRLVDADGCTPLANRAVYLWHCDRDGNYSMYTVATQNYLRGVQESNSDGVVEFQSIFPACYSGRWPHIHFEIYASITDAKAAGTPARTSQLALPQSVCEEVFATDGYEDSVQNLAQISLASDNVFSDGSDEQLAAVSGDVDAGYLAFLTVAL